VHIANLTPARSYQGEISRETTACNLVMPQLHLSYQGEISRETTAAHGDGIGRQGSYQGEISRETTARAP